MKVLKPLSSNAWCKWLVKPEQVSSPLKLKKTSCLHRWVEGEEEGFTLVSEAMVIYEQKVEMERWGSVFRQRGIPRDIEWGTPKVNEENKSLAGGVESVSPRKSPRSCRCRCRRRGCSRLALHLSTQPPLYRCEVTRAKPFVMAERESERENNLELGIMEERERIGEKAVECEAQ